MEKRNRNRNPNPNPSENPQQLLRERKSRVGGGYDSNSINFGNNSQKKNLSQMNFGNNSQKKNNSQKSNKRNNQDMDNEEDDEDEDAIVQDKLVLPENKLCIKPINPVAQNKRVRKVLLPRWDSAGFNTSGFY